jgi:hypothetical protein
MQYANGTKEESEHLEKSDSYNVGYADAMSNIPPLFIQKGNQYYALVGTPFNWTQEMRTDYIEGYTDYQLFTRTYMCVGEPIS